MKKITLLAVLCATMFGASAYAQDNNEPKLIEQPQQGYLFNRFKDNWFITAEGGVGFWTAPNAIHRNLMDRWSPAAGLYVGKRFSPLIATRIGANWLQTKGLTSADAANMPGVEREKLPVADGEYYRNKYSHIGPVFDVMFNLTNWICGYKPGRIFNADFYLGGGAYWTFIKDYKAPNQPTPVINAFDDQVIQLLEKNGWKDAKDRVLTFRAGLMASLNITKQVRISLDLRASAIDNHPNEQNVNAWNKTAYDFQAYLGVSYLFKKREWSPAVCPECQEPENCDPLRNRLAAAEARIADLEAQLKACLERPADTVVVEKTEKAPLATIYYPINVYTLTQKDVNVLRAVSTVMKDNADKKYVLTGWADNYTGNDVINTRLRKNRVAGVEKQLLKEGVPSTQIRSTINNNNLVDLGEKYQALGRAVTIEEDE
ncbi:MAG: hypothetical protein IJS19_03045 [Muribaculaceae bacterium]|nr:hypothetical protein [Muribaculaceae bacterium]